ncbi:MAG TPA: lactonase family protein [Saprospiraceae bacterium]|nr:lactonase family protein [Saprospiraceae bacterium]HMQ85643.1 lactonase family protein [Saprospiraceae bacterium]
MKNLLYLLPILMLSCQPTTSDNQKSTFSEQPTTDLLVGTYTKKEGHVDGKASGIYWLTRKEATWQTQYTAEGIINPSFIALSPNEKYLYAVSETGPEVDTTGYIYAYAVKDGTLQLLNRMPSFAFAPCFVSVHPSGKFIFVANYVGGVIVGYPLAENGALLDQPQVIRLEGSGPHPRQEASHPHSAFVSPDGQYLLVPDLGTDKVMVYAIDQQSGLMTAKGFASVAPGSGPRHLAFSEGGQKVYVLNELSSSVTVFRFHADNGSMDSLATFSTLPTDFKGENTCAHLEVSPNGQFLYASNRGHNSIVVFKIDGDSLQALAHTPTQGRTPRHFTITTDGKQLLAANQDTETIAIFDIGTDGLLTLSDQIEVPTPVCLVSF